MTSLTIQASETVQTSNAVFRRVLLLYGAFTLLANAAYLFGYYLLPAGFMRGSPQTAAGQVTAAAPTFWSEFGLTLLFNLVVVGGISIILNFNQVKGVPVGYLYPLFLAVTSGLIAGTNSFIASDLTQYSVWEGTALKLSIENLEMLGYVCIVAATVPFGVYQYKSWWRWSGKWRATKIMSFRDIRLTTWEWLVLLLGILLIIFAAYRETLLARGLL